MAVKKATKKKAKPSKNGKARTKADIAKEIDSEFAYFRDVVEEAAEQWDKKDFKSESLYVAIAAGEAIEQLQAEWQGKLARYEKELTASYARTVINRLGGLNKAIAYLKTVK